MSFQRLALLAAVNQHQHQKQQQQNKKISTTTTTITQDSFEHSENSVETEIFVNNNNSNNVTTTTSTIMDEMITPVFESPLVPPHLIINPMRSRNTNMGGDTGYSGGGWGVFHQQNIRGGVTDNGGSFFAGNNIVPGIGGSSSGTGTGYIHTANGNVNLLLGGAMLIVITTMLCVVCYCCHRNIKKRTEAEYRQQSQLMDNDPNMEIYSVEQFYGTSGMFMAESTDGLSTMPALSHEPPPSYDAVLAMHEQQQIILLQQQQLQQLQNSPPPGYRSTLDVNANNMLMGSGTVNTAAYDRATCDVNGNLNQCCQDPAIDEASSSCHNNNNNSNTPSNHNNIVPWKFYTINNNSSHLLSHGENMKKLLHVQSCCSLQRAEVESMWNAAAAAVAARQHVISNNNNSNNNNNMQINDNDMLHENCFMMRKSYPMRRVLGQQQQLQCDKFQYDNNEQRSLSASTEIGFNEKNNNYALLVNNDVATTSNALCSNHYNNNNISSSNINNNNNNICHEAAELCACKLVDYADNEDLRNGNTQLQTTCKTFISQEPTVENVVLNFDENANNSLLSIDAENAQLEATATATTTNENEALNAIDLVNENGIVRVDMS